MPTDYTSYWVDFRLPNDVQLPVYLRLQVTTAIATNAWVYLDDIAIAQGTSLYTGGPYISAFSGVTASADGDIWSLAIANDYAGEWQTWFNRAFGMAGFGLFLPTTSSGNTEIPDTLLS
jgi:hypothetical protein